MMIRLASNGRDIGAIFNMDWEEDGLIHVDELPTPDPSLTNWKYVYEDGVFKVEEFVPIIEPAVDQLDSVKASKLFELQTERDKAIYSSFSSSALGTEKTYNYDKQAADNFRAQGTLLSLDPTMDTVLWFVSTDRTFVSHTREQFIQVIKDGAAHDTSNQMKYFTLEQKVTLADTREVVEAITW